MSAVTPLIAGTRRLPNAYRRLAARLADEGEQWSGWRLVILLLIFIVAILSESPVDRVGDGGEYMAMARAIATGHSPSLSPAELRATLAYLPKLGTGWANLPIANPLLVTASHAQEFPHFWMYSLLAAPFVWFTDVVGIHPNYGFTTLNVILYLVAAVLGYRRLGIAAATFLFVSPVIWWWDKAHTEEFTFSLIAIAFLLLEEAPWWSVVALGLASTQNPPIAIAAAVLVVVAIARDRNRLRDRRMWAGIAVGAFFAVLHPIFYQLELGVLTPESKLGLVSAHAPTLAILLAPLIDLNIGLFFRFPMFGVAVVVVLAVIIRRGGRRLITLEHVAAAVIGIVFLVSFAQTTQVESGGTPAVDRYSLWLIPLLIPFLRTAYRSSRVLLTGALIPVVLVSMVLSFRTYAPARPEQYGVPTALASWIWEHEPSWSNPLPAIFFTRVAHSNARITSVGTPTCSKVLLVNGLPPRNCPVTPPPPTACSRTVATLCYANRSGSGYDYLLWTGPDGASAAQDVLGATSS